MKLLNNIRGKITWSMCATAICFLFVGCAKDNGSEVKDTEVLAPSFRTLSSDPTKSIVNGTASTAEKDKINSIGVYITTDDHNTYSSMTDRSSVWTLNSSNEWSNTSPITLNSAIGLMYAYSPSSLTVTAGANSTDNHTIAVEVDANQTFNGANTWECSVVDYMYGSSVATIGNEDVVEVSNADYEPEIYLQHALSQVVFKIQSVAGRAVNPTYDYVKSIALSVESPLSTPFLAGDNAVMSIKNGAITSLTAKNKITFTPKSSSATVLCGATGAPAIVGYGLAAPASYGADDKVVITLVLGDKDDNTHDRELSVTSDNLKVNMVKGKKYIFNLYLGDRKIDVKETKIGQWNEISEDVDLYPDGL